jgi:hypothetical protein
MFCCVLFPSKNPDRNQGTRCPSSGAVRGRFWGNWGLARAAKSSGRPRIALSLTRGIQYSAHIGRQPFFPKRMVKRIAPPASHARDLAMVHMEQFVVEQCAKLVMRMDLRYYIHAEKQCRGVIHRPDPSIKCTERDEEIDGVLADKIRERFLKSAQVHG